MKKSNEQKAAGTEGSAVSSGLGLSTARRNLCVALLVLLGFSLGCSEFVVIGIETELADAFGVSLQQVGTVMSFFAISYAVCTPTLALLTGRFKRYTMIVVYAVLFALGNLVAALAPTFEVLLLSRALIGAVSGGFLAVGVTFLPELLGAGRTSMAISMVYGAFSVAMVIATSAGKMAAELLGWHVAMEAVLVFSLVEGAALVALMPREGATDEPATVREQISLLGEPQILAGMVVFVFGVGSVYVFYGYITPYLEDMLGFSAIEASGVLIGYGCMCLISNIVSGMCDARFGMKALVPSFIVQAALMLLLFLVGAAMPAALVVIMGIALSMYVVSVPCVSMFMNTAAARHPKALTLASSLEPMAFNVGIAFGTAVGGFVVAGPGMHYAGLVGSVFSLVACALVVLSLKLGHRTRGVAAERVR